MQTELEIINAINEAIALKGVSLTESQRSTLIDGVKMEIADHDKRHATWVAAGMDVAPEAAEVNLVGAAKKTLRWVLSK